MPKLHNYFCKKYGDIFARKIWFSEWIFKYAIRIFQAANGVAMATKIRQNINQNWKKGHNFGPMQTSIGIFCSNDMLWSLNSHVLNTLKSVLPWQENVEKISKNCTDVTYVEEYNNLRFITITLLMLKNSKINVKTYLFNTQCKGDISHAFVAAKITVFDPVMCKTPDAPLQNELLY